MSRNTERLGEVAGAFRCEGTWLGDQPYGSGHINDTYRASYDDHGRPRRYIRQRINRAVFQDVPALMENIGRVTRHLRRKLEREGVADLERRVLTLVPTVDGKDFHVDANGDCWRTFAFIEGGRGYDLVEHTGQAFEVARAFGEFQARLADLPGRLHETIPRFHHARARFNALKKAVDEDSHGRADGAQREIEFALAREEIVDVVADLMAAGEIPERVAHNDTKLNNVLLDKATGQALCVIDLDTTMPGSVLYDFGDMVRTTTSMSAEDETDLSRVEMDIRYFEALVRGYLQAAAGFLVPRERELLAFSGKLITYVIGIRFLADYLQGDSYFKTRREAHNRDRCRAQFKLVESMERQMQGMQRTVAAS